MNSLGKIIGVNPSLAIPGGEIVIECDGLEPENFADFKLLIGDENAKFVSVSNSKIIAIVPKVEGEVLIRYRVGEEFSNEIGLTVGIQLADGLHMVSNPAVDPKDNSVVLTNSGRRGEELPNTLYRLETDGALLEMSASVLNPTGVAFNPHGKLFVSNRADGEVCKIENDSEVIPFSSGLGVATGIAFDKDGTLYVGDRTGLIFKVNNLGNTETWTILEPSVSAYHLTFGADARLYATAPGLSGFDCVYRIDEDGTDEIFYKGLGRPQGLALDTEGFVYVAACLRGRRGVIKISPDGKDAQVLIAGKEIVGLCFTRNNTILIATADELYSLPIDANGVLLD
ncbi:MAG: gluconolaconase [Pyrinomonadaceae bacterium]